MKHGIPPELDECARGEAVLDEHGSALYVLATLLTDDTRVAEDIVIQAIIAHLGGPATLRELSAAVHLAWACRFPGSDEHHSRQRTSRRHPMFVLPVEERAALGLCRFGGHTYRSAAAVLGLPPELVADQLTSALRGLATPRHPAAQNAA